MNSTETVLTLQNVSVLSFGKLASIPVQGDIYGQPLYVPQVKTSDGRVRNLVFVATEHDQVYAIDADSHVVVWQKDFVDMPGVTTLSASDFPQSCALPEVGITGTPAIDINSSTLYVVVRTKQTTSGQPEFFQRIHALDLTTGQDKVTPTTITTPSDPDGQFRGSQFDPLYNNQRAALLLSKGQVYVAWASFCDLGTYLGWVMSFDAATLQNTGGWTPTAGAYYGGIWMSASGPAADENGDIYVSVGNAWTDIMFGGTNVGNSVVKVRSSGGQMSLVDYFVPFNWETLWDNDYDVASGGPVLLPTDPNSRHPHKLTIAAKDGTVYLLDRDNLGHWNPDNNSQILQTFSSGADFSFSTPAVLRNAIYYGFYSTPLRLYELDPSTEQINTTPMSETTSFNCDPSCSSSISTNGDNDAIVWALRHTLPTADLSAFDAHDLSRELWSNQMSPARDQAGEYVQFSVPTVADGMVFIGTKGELDIYGLLPN